jgi:hypothetical protein
VLEKGERRGPEVWNHELTELLDVHFLALVYVGLDGVHEELRHPAVEVEHGPGGGGRRVSYLFNLAGSMREMIGAGVGGGLAATHPIVTVQCSGLLADEITWK